MSAKARSAWTMFAAGLATGVGIGWLAFAERTAERPSDTASEATTLAPSRAAREPRARAETPPAESAPEPVPSDGAGLVRVTMDAPADQLRRAASEARQKDRKLAALDYKALDARITEARRTGDADLMRALLDVLVAAGTDGSRARLLELIQDDSFVFPDRSTGGLRAAFLENGSPELAAAARGRFDAEMKARNCDAAMKSGWQRLVADHGTEGDIAWLWGLRDEWNAMGYVLEALGESPQPAARSRAEQAFREGRGLGREFADYCAKRGEEAFPLAWEISSAYFRGEPVSRDLEEGEFLRQLAATVPKDRFDEVRNAVQACPDPHRRVHAVALAAALVRRGFDRAALDPLLLYAVETIERLPSTPRAQDDGGVATSATYAIEYNRDYLWTQRSAEALEGCARRFGTDYPHEHLEQVAKIIRAHLADPWRRK